MNDGTTNECEFCGKRLTEQREQRVLGYPDMADVSALLGDAGGNWWRVEEEFPGFRHLRKDYHADWKVCDACYEKASRILGEGGRLPEREAYQAMRESYRRQQDEANDDSGITGFVIFAMLLAIPGTAIAVGLALPLEGYWYWGLLVAAIVAVVVMADILERILKALGETPVAITLMWLALLAAASPWGYVVYRGYAWIQAPAVAKKVLAKAGGTLESATSGTIVKFSGSDFDDGRLLEVIDPLGDLRDLLVLDLSGTSVGDRGVEALRDIRVANLVLSGTNVTDKGVAALGHEFGPISLDLSETDVTGSGLSDFPEDALALLDLSSSRFTERELDHVSQQEELVVLRLANTPLTDEGLKDLSADDEIDLSGTRVTPEGVIDRFRLFRSASRLLVVLDDMPYEERDRRRIESALEIRVDWSHDKVR